MYTFIKRFLLMIGICLSCVSIAVAQEPDDEIYPVIAVDQMPTFPGGDSALMEYISKNIKYPANAAKNGIEGRVVVQFVVTKTGSIGEVKVVRPKSPDLDKEAVRVVKTLPKFNPAYSIDGEPVAVWYTLPIKFSLPKD
ncbi:MAG: energy transducer TonB [Muribaculaceae bacterium]|nr:energy transducer TonB [Muribaculaceae bacterium]